MTTVDTETALDCFIAETRELFDQEPDPEKRWEAMPSVLGRLLADPSVLEASKHWPECIMKDRAENLLFYVDPEYGFAINCTKTRPNYGERRPHSVHPDWRGIHDHAHIYTCYGMLTGQQTLERYERVGEATPDHVEIKLSGTSDVGAGTIDLVKPYEIHAERSLGEECIAVIIRSEKSGEFLQGRYTVGTGEYWEGQGPRQTPVEMFGYLK
jgi:predicted metal-dependent enzyme (double-stranded beta helix superfamily)